MSGFYAFLGANGLIGTRQIEKMTTVVPGNLSDSSIAVTICRIIFKVYFQEASMEGEGAALEEIAFKASDNGEVSLLDIIFDNKAKEEE
jgi:hypothetical protein